MIDFLLATYVHNLDPVLVDIWGPLKLRWYGLGYLLSFVAAFFLLRWLARKDLWVLPEEKVSDFIAYAAFFGVFLGGRLGYILFYHIPEFGFSQISADPLLIFRVWEGGMASHGGILGLMIFTFIYARKHKVSWTGVGDGLCVVAPLGLFFVRCANFINGELYGRIDKTFAWAMKFPAAFSQDMDHTDKLTGNSYARDNAWLHLTDIDPELNNQPYEVVIEKARSNPELSEALGEHLHPRHPSQLYEALLEGLVLFAILLFIRLKFPKLANGVLTGLFFILYASFRIFVEQFREPDSEMILLFTKGQFYSLFMIVIGLGFIITAVVKKRKQSADA
ncbi:prolipoprotein diacylglyceryl transferase [Persicirhabdus sediminis]|uniref:Phosphatidylglycerol--prolipoprotein diacylglyceryl transferase n=1 Tax=Persicirhabdus sediminis TaxID=454144 RepID=A0A8J7MFV5_9BACT|nr:prolipoprotein diacylglyceryl transferase [Persicirhabdus sediminis]